MVPQKMGVPQKAYLACMNDYLDGATEYGWYLCMDGDQPAFYERYGWEFLCMAQGDGEPKPSRMYIHR